MTFEFKSSVNAIGGIRFFYLHFKCFLKSYTGQIFVAFDISHKKMWKHYGDCDYILLLGAAEYSKKKSSPFFYT